MKRNANIYVIQILLIFFLFFGLIFFGIAEKVYEGVYEKMQKQEKQAQESSTMRWLIDSIVFFQKLEFFSEYEELPTDYIAKLIAVMHQKEWKFSFEAFNPISDLFITHWDPKRVWWSDFDIDIQYNDGQYPQILNDLKEISRGVFSPENIREEWVHETGPITLVFDLNNEPQEIILKNKEGYFDIALVPQINNMIHSSGYQFEMYEPFKETCFLVVLTKQEKELIEKERKWKFYEFS